MNPLVVPILLAPPADEPTPAQRAASYRTFDAAPACLALLREPNHQFEYVNLAYQQLFPGTELLGRTMEEVLPTAVEYGFIALLDRVYQTGEPYFGHEMLLAVPLPDGEPPHEYYLDFTYQATWEDGRVVGIAVFALNVTERVRARAQQARQQAQLESLFDQAPSPIAILDGAEMVFQFVNPAFQRFFGNRELLGRPLALAMPELAATVIPGLLARVYRIGQPYTAQELPLMMARETDGPLQLTYWTFTCQARRDDHEVVNGVIVFAHDVTESVQARQRTEENRLQVERLNQELAEANQQLVVANRELAATNQRLTRSNEDLDNFVYAASHDLKTPINNVEGLLLALHEELDPLPSAAPEVPLLLAMMQGAVDRFKRTLASLTDVLRLDLALPPPVAPLPLTALVEDLRQDLAPLLAATGGELRVELADDLAVVLAEASLRSILFNLLSNAVKYHHPDRPPRVVLRIRATATATVLEVQDNGLGLTPAQQARLFGLFQRLHDHVEGTGVGLYTVKKIVESAGGTVGVESEAGVGSVFRVSLPR